MWEGESQPVTASTVANLKEVVIPSEKVAVYSDMSTVLAASNQTFLPRYYTSLSLYNKKGKLIPIIRCQLFPTHQETNIQQQFRNLNWKNVCTTI